MKEAGNDTTKTLTTATINNIDKLAINMNRNAYNIIIHQVPCWLQ